MAAFGDDHSIVVATMLTVLVCLLGQFGVSVAHYHQPGPFHGIESDGNLHHPMGHSSLPTAPLVDIDSDPLPLTIRFNSHSSRINTVQKHSGQPAKVLRALHNDEPDQLIHQVNKPIVQRIHEVVTPVRTVTQEVRPVKEQIETVLAKDSALGPKSNQDNYEFGARFPHTRNSASAAASPSSEDHFQGSESATFKNFHHQHRTEPASEHQQFRPSNLGSEYQEPSEFRDMKSNFKMEPTNDGSYFGGANSDNNDEFNYNNENSDALIQAQADAENPPNGVAIRKEYRYDGFSNTNNNIVINHGHHHHESGGNSRDVDNIATNARKLAPIAEAPAEPSFKSSNIFNNNKPSQHEPSNFNNDNWIPSSRIRENFYYSNGQSRYPQREKSRYNGNSVDYSPNSRDAAKSNPNSTSRPVQSNSNPPRHPQHHHSPNHHPQPKTYPNFQSDPHRH